jgi:hypothetical protein
MPCACAPCICKDQLISWIRSTISWICEVKVGVPGYILAGEFSDEWLANEDEIYLEL